MGIRIQEGSFDPGAELNGFSELTEGAGAIVTFTGLVRSTPGDPITILTLECYPELALNQIGEIVHQAHDRFALLDEVVIHRYGTLKPGEPIVQVMTLAPHREAAFDAARFLMDYLKTDAPFWKKEATAAGDRWVEHRDADGQARARWSE
jgi:molybdopterin synthase catalytic subunit